MTVYTWCSVVRPFAYGLLIHHIASDTLLQVANSRKFERKALWHYNLRKISSLQRDSNSCPLRQNKLWSARSTSVLSRHPFQIFVSIRACSFRKFLNFHFQSFNSSHLTLSNNREQWSSVKRDYNQQLHSGESFNISAKISPRAKFVVSLGLEIIGWALLRNEPLIISRSIGDL